MKITLPSAPSNQRFRKSLALCPPKGQVSPGDWGSEQAEQAQRGDLLFIFKPFSNPADLDETIDLDGVAFVFREDAGCAMSYYMDDKTFEMGFLEGVLSAKAQEAADAGSCFAYCAAHLIKPADEESMKRLANMHKWGTGQRHAAKDGLPDPLYYYLTTLSIAVDPTLSNSPVSLAELFVSLVNPDSLPAFSKSPPLGNSFALYTKGSDSNDAATDDLTANTSLTGMSLPLNALFSDGDPNAAAPTSEDVGSNPGSALRDLFGDAPPAKPPARRLRNPMNDMFGEAKPAAKPAVELAPQSAQPAASSLRDLFGDASASKPAAASAQTAAPSPTAPPDLRNLFADTHPVTKLQPSDPVKPTASSPLRDLFSDNVIPKAKPEPPSPVTKPEGKGLSLDSLFADESPAAPPSTASAPAPTPTTSSTAAIAEPVAVAPAAAPVAEVKPASLNSLFADESPAAPPATPSESASASTTSSTASTSEPAAAALGTDVESKTESSSASQSTARDDADAGSPVGDRMSKIDAILADLDGSSEEVNAVAPITPPVAEQPVSADVSPAELGIDESSMQPANETDVEEPASSDSSSVEGSSTDVISDSVASPAFEEISFKKLKTMSLNELLSKLEEQSRTAQERLEAILEIHQTEFQKDISSFTTTEVAEELNLAGELKKSTEELLQRLKDAASTGSDSLRAKSAEAKKTIQQKLERGKAELEELSPVANNAAVQADMQEVVKSLETDLHDRLLGLVTRENDRANSLSTEQPKRFTDWLDSRLPQLKDLLDTEGFAGNNTSIQCLQHHIDAAFTKLRTRHGQELSVMLIAHAQQLELLHNDIDRAEVSIRQSSENLLASQILPATVVAKAALAQQARNLAMESLMKLRGQIEQVVGQFAPVLSLGREAIAVIENNGLELKERVQKDEQRILDEQLSKLTEWFESSFLQLQSNLGTKTAGGENGERADDRQVQLNNTSAEIKEKAKAECDKLQLSFREVVDSALTDSEKHAEKLTQKHKTDMNATVESWQLKTSECISSTSARLDDIRKKIQDLHGQFLK